MAEIATKSGYKGTKTKRAYDYSLLFLTIFLVALGLVFVYSAGSYTCEMKYGDATHDVKKQAIFGVAGIIFMLIVSGVDYKLYKKVLLSVKIRSADIRIRPVHILYLICIALQILVLKIGEEIYGAKRWIEIKGFGSFQPSEITKIMMIVFVATICSEAPKALNYVGKFIVAMLYAVPPIVLVAVEDLSTALVITGIYVIVCFIVGENWLYFAALFCVGVGAVLAYIKFGDPFRFTRIQAWRNVDTSEYAHQIRRGLYAISSGGITGKGLGQGSMKLGFVPEAHNDMIFTIICEELGLVGAIAIILLFILLLWRIITVAINAPDLFGSLLCVGVFAHIALQVVMNIAVVTNVIPCTGIALPFISYGGTALVILLCEIGMVLSVSLRIEIKQ